jgi:hypothetical protein
MGFGRIQDVRRYERFPKLVAPEVTLNWGTEVCCVPNLL